MSHEVAPDTAASLLRSFDGTRFAALALEGGVRPGGGEEEGGGSSSAAAAAAAGGKVGGGASTWTLGRECRQQGREEQSVLQPSWQSHWRLCWHCQQRLHHWLQLLNAQSMGPSAVS